MGLLGVFRESVTLVNRTSRDLTVRYDGEDLIIHPGENPGFPADAAPFAKRQNMLKGSRHPLNPMKFISLFGVLGTKDDCTPIPEEVLEAADGKLEVVDRNGEHWGEPLEKKVQLLRKRPWTEDEAALSMPSNPMGDSFSNT